MKLELTRSEAATLLLLCGNKARDRLAASMSAELDGAAREIAKDSADYYQSIRDKIKEQLDVFDSKQASKK